MSKNPTYFEQMSMAQPAPPAAASDRISQQALRVRMLKGQHEQDIQAEVEADFDPSISMDLAYRVDMSSNVFLSCWKQLAVAYDAYPSVSTEGDQNLSTIVTPDLWPLSATRQLWQMALNEALVRCDIPREGSSLPPEIIYRVVDPSMIYAAKADRDNPEQVSYVCELRSRSREMPDGTAKMVWTFEEWSIEDPDNPWFKITEDIQGVRVDVTSDYLGDTGGEYPYRDTDDRPIMPYIVYHSKIQSRLWDYLANIELVRGSLRLASFYCWFADCFKNGANPIRCAIDLDLPAGSARTLTGGKPIQSVAVGPKTIVKLHSLTDRTGTISTFPPGLDPETALESLRRYSERLAIFSGVSPADLQRTSGAQSGIAIQVSRDGMRKAQLKAEGPNRKYDTLLLATAARMANAYLAGAGDLPEDPRAYRINYSLVGQSDYERKMMIENIGSEMAMGTISPVEAVMKLHPELESKEAAIQHLLAIGEEAAALEAAQAEAAGIETPIASDIQATALNGAQVTAAQGIVEAVALGKLPRETATQMISRFFSIAPEAADAILGPVGTTFKITEEG